MGDPPERLPPGGFDVAASVSKFPVVWLGFVIAAIALATEIIDVVTGAQQTRFFYGLTTPEFLIVTVGGGAYWLYCVSRIHRLLRDNFSYYPINPVEAWAYQLIPFFGLYWVFRWPTAMTNFIRDNSNLAVIPGWVLGALILASFLVARFFDAAVGMVGYFAVLVYLAGRVRTFLEQVWRAQVSASNEAG